MKYVTREGVEVEVSISGGMHFVADPTMDLRLYTPTFKRFFRPASEPSEFVSVKRAWLAPLLGLWDWVESHKPARTYTSAEDSAMVAKLRDALTPKAAECKHGNWEHRESIEGPLSAIRCPDCGMTRERGWTSDWQQPETSDGH